MKEKTGRVYSVAEENAPVPGCTISREISDGERYIGYFSLAEDTDISAEIYTYHKLLIVAEGRLEVYFGGKTLSCGALEGEGIIGYEGEEHPIKAGENFCFARGGRHSVKANGRFKMALLLVAN